MKLKRGDTNMLGVLIVVANFDKLFEMDTFSKVSEKTTVLLHKSEPSVLRLI
jgi:hypothetical protein